MNMRIHPGSRDDHEDRLVAGGTIGACVTEVTLAALKTTASLGFQRRPLRRAAVSWGAAVSGVPP
jgi:hypothetical protein